MATTRQLFLLSLGFQAACSFHYGAGARLSVDTDGRIGVQGVGSGGVGKAFDEEVGGAFGVQGGLGYRSGPSDLFITVGPQVSLAVLDREPWGTGWRPGVAADLTLRFAGAFDWSLAPRGFLGVLRTMSFQQELPPEDCGQDVAMYAVCIEERTFGLVGYEIGYSLLLDFDPDHLAHRLSVSGLYEEWVISQD